MDGPSNALSGMPGPGVHVAGVHIAAVGMGPGVGGATGAGVLAFTGVGPGTLPLAIAGLASIVAGAAATVWSRDKKKGKGKSPRRKHLTRWQDALPDLSHLANSPAP